MKNFLVMICVATILAFGMFSSASAAVETAPETTETPEPATMLLLGAGMTGLATLKKRFGKKR